jgi:hypothetical protein
MPTRTLAPTAEEQLAELTSLAVQVLGPAYRVSIRPPRSFSVAYPNGSPVVVGPYTVVYAYLAGYRAGYAKHRADFI